MQRTRKSREDDGVSLVSVHASRAGVVERPSGLSELTSRTSLSTLSPLQHQMDRPAWLFESPSLVCTPTTVSLPPSGVATQIGAVENVVDGGTVCDHVGLVVDTCQTRQQDRVS